MAFDAARGVVLSFGGYASGAWGNETWAWDGATWRRLNPIHRPGPRFGASMAYDPVTERVVLYGGALFDPYRFFDETWTWDGADWDLVRVPSGPRPSVYHPMAYDPISRRVLAMAGGAEGEQFWSWDGSAWNPIATPVGPYPGSSVYPSTLAYDSVTRKMLLFTNWGEPTTWLWDRSTWARITGVSPPSVAHSSFGMATMTANGTVVMYGGTGGADTWIWNGSTWEMRPRVPGSPPAVGTRELGWYRAALAYDAARNEVVMVDINGSTWAWDGYAWRLRADAGL